MKNPDLIKEMDAVIKKHKAEEKAKEKKKEEVKKSITIEDLQKLLVEVNANKKPTVESSIDSSQQPILTQQQQPMRQKQPSKDQQIAYQLWKDSKSTSIVCLIAIVMPMIAVLVTMFPGGAMFALVVAMCGIIYPCIVLVKMIGLQMRAYRKYGLKPLLMFRSQQPMMQMPKKQPNQNQPGFF